MKAFFDIWHQWTGLFHSAITKLAGVYAFAGDHRWVLAIVTLTVIVRTLLLPIAIKQIRSMRDQQRLQPEIQRLRQKYSRDRQKMTEEMMALYRREGVNPYAACLPMVAQMPVFFAMFRVIRDLTTVPAKYVKQLAPIAAKKGVAIEVIARQQHIIPNLPFLGLGSLSGPAFHSVGGWVLLAIMTATQFISTRQLNPGATDQQRRMQMMLPFFFVFIMFRFPTGVVLYWATQNVYQFVQQMVMLRGWNVSHWFAKEAPERTKRVRPAVASPEPATAEPSPATPIAPVQAFGSAATAGFGSFDARRDLAEKRKRRRRKKRKRRK